MWFVIVTSFVCGILFILFVEIIFIYQWWIHKPVEKPSHQVDRPKVKNPEELAKLLKKFAELPEDVVKEQLSSPETCTCLNLIFAFLWREWRDSPQMKRLIVSKLNREFSDLIGSKAAKGYIDEINIKSYSLGAALPIIKDIRLIGIKSQSAEHVPDEINMAMDIKYSGGFYVSADFALALINKSLYLSIKVSEISGRVRLSFRRNPASHWSFSFFEDPEPKIELDAESRFEGKNIQQLTSLITKHFKKVIRRKYILPNYVIRYKPFLMVKVPQDEQHGIYIHNSQVTVGTVVVKVIGCSRLPLQKKCPPGNLLFCSLSVDSIPFAERKNVDPSVWPVAECEMLRSGERKIGLTFHEVSSTEGDVNQKKIVVDSIDPESPAGYSTLKEGDIILEINGKNVTDAKQVAKLIKISNRRISLVVKRPPSYMPLTKTKELSQKIDIGAPLSEMSAADFDEEDSIDDEFINIVKPLIQMSSSQSEASKGNMDIPGLGHNVPLRHDVDGFDKSSSKKIDDAKSSPILIRKSDKNGESEELLYLDDAEKPVNTFESKTASVQASKNPEWDQEFELTVEKEHKYLNVLVWYRTKLESVKEEENEEQQTKEILLGYVTIPLTDIAVQCLETGDRYNQQEYVLVSTAYDKVLASRAQLNDHPGLNRATCGGDITLAFIYKPFFDNDKSVKTKVHTSEQMDKERDEISGNPVSADFEVRKHNFVDTQFHHPTKCEFCTKKIWTKSAYKCRLCSMVCHKKCLQRAQMYTQCHSQPGEVSRPEEGDDDADTETRSDMGKIQVDAKTLKKHGIDPSEISSLDNMSSAIAKVKKVGKELYPELSSTNKKMKLEEMISKLQNEIDEENENRVKLYASKNASQSKPPNSSSKLEQLIIKSEQKSDSLKLLMLQFCSGLVTCESET